MGKNTNLGSGTFCYVRSIGIDNREIFNNSEDISRFIIYLDFLNSEHGRCFFRDINQDTLKPRSRWISRDSVSYEPNIEKSRLVSIIAFSTTPFEINLLLHEEVPDGIARFMQKLLGGYTRYYNEKYEREGSLFAGRYKREYISDDEVSYFTAYINMYHLTKPRKYWCSERTISSLSEYSDKPMKNFPFISTNTVLGRFKDVDSYRTYATQAVLKLVREFELDSEQDAISVLQSH